MDDLEYAEYLASQSRELVYRLKDIQKAKTTETDHFAGMYWIIRRSLHRAIRRDDTVTSIKADRARKKMDEQFGHLPPGERLRAFIDSITPEEQAKMRARKERIAALLEDQLSSIPHHQEKAARRGKEYWIDLSESYMGLSD